jgi:site-specific DNA-cytosine methylase
MGWPDQHTAHGITEAGKPYQLADTARYKLCGNGIASPVTAWIGFQLRHYLTNV